MLANSPMNNETWHITLEYKKGPNFVQVVLHILDSGKNHRIPFEAHCEPETDKGSTYDLFCSKEQWVASVQRLGTRSGSCQRRGQGHRLEMNSVSLLWLVGETEAPEITNTPTENTGKLHLNVSVRATNTCNY